MAEKPASERTEQPTPKRLEKARKEGQVARSQELPAAVAVAALTLVLAVSAPSLLRWFMEQVEQGLAGNQGIVANPESFVRYFNGRLGNAIFVMLPVLAGLFAAGVLSCVAISGLNFSPKALKPKLSELDPVKGFGRLFNVRALVKLLVSVAKVLVVGSVVCIYIQDRTHELASLRWTWSMQMTVFMAKLIFGMLVRVCVVLIVIAVIESVFQKWKYLQELKMTKQEVKQERKDMEGSPELKGRIRRVQYEMSQNRMLQEIPKSDVVIVNPTHVAVVLKYDAATMNAPTMVAKGADLMAEKIREIARAYGVPIIRKPALARTIYSTVKEGQPVPGALYTAVAEVLAMVYRLRRNRG